MRTVRGDAVISLADLELFRELDAETLAFLQASIERIDIKGGQALFHQGDTDDSMYLVLTGRLSVVVERSDGPAIVGEIAPGETIGEMSVVSDEPRSVSVLALRDSVLARIPSDVVRRLFDLCPDFLLKLARLLADRLKKAYRRDDEQGRVGSIALVFLDRKLDTQVITERFKEALSRWGTVNLIVPERAASGLVLPGQASGEGPANFTRWLNDQELAHEFMLYRLDPDPSPWNEICLRQADRVLVVTSGRDRRHQTPAEERLWKSMTAPFPRCELVRIHESASKLPSGTNSWLRGRSFNRHHQVVANRPQDFDRVIRLVTSRCNGLVLGGGGARGFAHIGVVRALAEHGIPIDHVGGTSMGAFIAAESAMGMDYQQMLEINHEAFILSNPTNDYTFPFVSLLAGKKCNRNLQQVFDAARIEDLWLPLFCVSANLTTSHAMVHDRGPVWEAVRASVSIPGVFPPVLRDGNILVDGGIVDMLPVMTARKRHPGHVIAVQLSGKPRLSAPRIDSATAHNWRLLTDLASGATARRHIPTIIQILMATGTIGVQSSALQARASADLCISPPVEKYDTLDWKPLRDIAETGYKAAMQALEDTDLAALGIATTP